jgi:hypothetical protein
MLINGSLRLEGASLVCVDLELNVIPSGWGTCHDAHVAALVNPPILGFAVLLSSDVAFNFGEASFSLKRNQA